MARKPISAERATGTTETTARYAGRPALMLHGFPGTPGPATNILLANGNHVYQIVVPGARMAADRRAVPANLRCIPRVGPFPGEVSG